MKIRLVILTLLSAISFSIALPNEIFPYGNAPLGFVALSPLFVALILSPSLKFSSLLGILFGAISSALTNYWLMFFQQFSIWTLGGVILGYTLYNAILAPIITGSSRYNPQHRIFVITIVWTIYEYLKSSGFLGYPWGLIAYPVNRILPLIQFVDITGVWGVSFLMALSNATIAEIVIHTENFRLNPRPKFNTHLNRQFLFTTILFIIVLLYGIIRLAQLNNQYKSLIRRSLYDKAGKIFSVLLVQQNTNPWKSERGKESILINEKLTQMGIQESKYTPDLVVWSESSLTYPPVGYGNFFEKFPKQNPLLPFIRRTGTNFLIGGPVLLPPKDGIQLRAMNSAILFNSHGKVVKYYGKQHPVPFAESIPFWEIQWVRNLFRKLIGIENIWVMGNQYTIFTINLRAGGKIKFGTPICFEDAFPYLNREFIKKGADLLINITNDSWSRTVSAETQHFVAAKFRAIENRRYLLRSTTAGVTGIIAPTGQIVKTLPLFKADYTTIKLNIPDSLKITIYTRFGDYFPLLLILLYLSFLIRNAYKTYRLQE